MSAALAALLAGTLSWISPAPCDPAPEDGPMPYECYEQPQIAVVYPFGYFDDAPKEDQDDSKDADPSTSAGDVDGD